MSSPDQPEVSKFRGRPAKAKKHAGRAPIYTFPEDITAPEKVAFYIENKKSKDAGNGALEPENWLEEYRERAPPVKKSPGRASIYNIPPGWKPSEKSSFYLAAKAARDQGDAIPDPKTWLEEYRTREKKPRGRPAAVKAEVKKAVAGRGRGRPATKAKVENSSTPTSPKTNKTTDAARVLIETLAASEGFKTALEEAREGGAEGGIPIGACLVAADGVILAQGRNMRIQGDSAIQHAETAAFENAGRLPASAYQGATMFTTLSPCDMCTGACLLYGVQRVVIGENKTFLGGERLLKKRGIEVIVLDNDECKNLMVKFIDDNPDEWNEDIGIS